jgi:hypothetical protein
MCRPAHCSTCGKTTWAGCGQHVDQVMAHVPADQQCSCHAEDAAAASVPGASFFGSLFNRG